MFRVLPDAGPQLLLLRRAPGRIFPGLWQCVTGGVEPGERVPMAALREVGEELGFGPSEIEAFYDLDAVTHFYDDGPDAIVAGAVFATRVRPTPSRRSPTSTTRRAGSIAARAYGSWCGQAMRRPSTAS